MASESQTVISVVAGGWSVNEVDLSTIPGFIIGVNDSAYQLPRVDAAVSMDRRWAENRKEFILGSDLPVYLRNNATRLPELREARNVTLYKCDNESVSFGPTTAHMNGTSSATVALNLAYIMWPQKLYLFGFDMCRGPHDEAHWYPDYPWNVRSTKAGRLAQWSREFTSIYEEMKRKKIEVFNVSSRSRITVWKRYDPRDLGMERRRAS
jgi:hypothetical protein